MSESGGGGGGSSALDSQYWDQLKDPEMWLGSDYELALAAPLGSAEAATRLRIIQALQDDPHVDGFVATREDLGGPWMHLDEANVMDHDYYYGVMRIPDKRMVGCKLFFLSGEFETWRLLAVPLGMLGLVYPVEYPVAVTSPWIAEFDAILAGIAARVYQRAPFVYGALGEEASALEPTAERISVASLDQPGLIVPTILFQRFNLAPHGVRLNEGLWWTGPWTGT